MSNFSSKPHNVSFSSNVLAGCCAASEKLTHHLIHYYSNLTRVHRRPFWLMTLVWQHQAGTLPGDDAGSGCKMPFIYFCTVCIQKHEMSKNNNNNIFWLNAHFRCRERLYQPDVALIPGVKREKWELLSLTLWQHFHCALNKSHQKWYTRIESDGPERGAQGSHKSNRSISREPSQLHSSRRSSSQ